jgi:hypothetical protein
MRTALSQTFPIRAHTRAPAGSGGFAKVGHPPAPSAPYKTPENCKALGNQDFVLWADASEGAEGAVRQPDPADAYPTKASIKTAFDRWTAEGQPWPPPAGLTSAIASCLIPRRTMGGKKWR